MRRRTGGQWRFDHHAEIEKFAYQLLLVLQESGERIDQALGGDLTHHGARTLARLNHADQFQASDGVADGTAADSEHLSKLALSRKLIARMQLGKDQPFNLPGDLFVNFVSTNRLKFRLNRTSHPLPPSGLISGPEDSTPLVKPKGRGQSKIFFRVI